MKIFYPYSEYLPSEKARALQVVNTCYALAEAGPEVRLFAGLKKSGLDILTSYGLNSLPNLSFIAAPVLREFSLLGLKVSWDGIFRHNCFEWLKREAGKGKFFLYTRHLKIAFSLLKKFPQLPLIYEMHEIFSLNRPDRLSLENFILANSRGLVFISQNLRKKTEELFTLKVPAAVIPDGVNPGLIEEAKKKAIAGEVVYVGQLYPWKGVRTLVRAMSHLPGLRLTIVGGGRTQEKREIESLITRLKLGDRVRLTGFLPHFEAIRYMTGARVLVLPLEDEPISRYFTSPLKLFEYMASGVPIVASDLPTIREVLSHGENALLARPGDEKGLANFIDSFFQDKALAQALAHKAYILSQDYSWRKRAGHIMKFLASIAKCA